MSEAVVGYRRGEVLGEESGCGRVADDDFRGVLETGTLFERARIAAKRAVESGALRPIRATPETVEDHGIPFTVWRREKSNAELPADRARLEKPIWSESVPDPFLPYDPAVFVSELTPTHVCLLNKYNILDTHLLLITRTFEHQSEPLTVADFEALRLCLVEFDGLGFYNAGRVAGASQRHKHLQYVPFPLAPGDTRAPIMASVAAARWEAGIGVVDVFPFVHGLVRPVGSDVGDLLRPAALHARYCSLLDSVGIDGRQCRPQPYNLLVTREWMMVVPRSEEAYHGISVNALGFAGSLLASNDAEFADICSVGPLGVLTNVGVAR